MENLIFGLGVMVIGLLVVFLGLIILIVFIKVLSFITDRTTGARYFYGGDAAGTEHESGLLSLGLQYTF